MQVQRLANGFAPAEISTNHQLLLAQERLWLFELGFKDQKTHSFGNHVVHAGTTKVLSFGLKDKKWSEAEFPALTDEENVSELLFTFEDHIYLLLFVNFGAVEFKNFYKWNGRAFHEVPLKAPAAIHLEPQARVTAVKACGITSKSEIVVILNGEGMHSFKVTIEDEQAIADPFLVFHDKPSTMAGSAVAAYINNDKLAVGYGVMGCGFRWQSDKLVIVDLNSEEVKDVTVRESELDGHPHFCFSGAKSHSILQNHNNGWAHVAGSTQIGMTGSKFDGSVWLIKSVFGEPEWKKVHGEVPESILLIEDNIIYSVTGDDVNQYTIA